MKILHAVEFYHPSVGGAQTVVQQVSERLAARGHDVTVLTSHLDERTSDSHRGVRIVPFRASGNLARGLRGEIERYREVVRQSAADIVMVYAAQQWTCDALLPVLPGLAARKVLVPCGFSGLHWPDYRDYYRQMPEFLRRFDALVVLSDRYRDTAFAREHGAGPLVLIPNGADEHEFSPPAPGLRESFRERFAIRPGTVILTVGSHTGWKGHDLAIEGFRRAALRDATLVVIGNHVPGGCARDCSLRSLRVRLSPSARRDRKQVRLLEAGREDTVAAYHAADLVLFPSRIECSPLVLFEAMAAGKAFATTPAGNAEEIIEWSGGGVLIAGRQAPDGSTTATPDDVARSLEALVGDPAQRARLGRQGHEAWRARFTFERIADAYEALYQRLLSGSPAPALP